MIDDRILIAIGRRTLEDALNIQGLIEQLRTLDSRVKALEAREKQDIRDEILGE